MIQMAARGKTFNEEVLRKVSNDDMSILELTCRKIQIPAAKPAMGHAIKIKRASHKMAKMKFLAMVSFSARSLCQPFCDY